MTCVEIVLESSSTATLFTSILVRGSFPATRQGTSLRACRDLSPYRPDGETAEDAIGMLEDAPAGAVPRLRGALWLIFAPAKTGMACCGKSVSCSTGDSFRSFFGDRQRNPCASFPRRCELLLFEFRHDRLGKWGEGLGERQEVFCCPWKWNLLGCDQVVGQSAASRNSNRLGGNGSATCGSPTMPMKSRVSSRAWRLAAAPTETHS